MSYMQTHTHHSFHDELRERAKLEGHHLSPDDEHLSQPSTMHSLGNLEDHFSPVDGTPSSASKAGQVGQHLKQEVKQQASQIKSMLFRTFGEKVDTYRDNSPEIKQQVSKINEEIKQLPKREEQVVESQGHGDSKEGLKEMSNQASGKISELMDNIYRHGERLREFGEKSGEDSDSVDPARDLSEKSKEQLNKLNQDIKQLPRKGEQIVEGNGRAKEKEPSKDTSSKSNSNDLWDIAFHKIEEMKQRAQQKGQEFKQQAQSIAQKASEHHEIPSHQEHHHHLSVGSQSFQPTEHSKVLAETVQEVLKDSSVPLIEKVEEFENEWKHTHEQPEKKEEEDSQLSLRKPQIEHMKEIPAQIVQEIEKKIESHREKAEEEIPEKKEEPKEEKAEVEKVKEREPLLDKVLHRIHTVSDNIHNTVESFRSAFKIEERAPESEVEQPKKREPLIDKVFNKVHAVSDNIHHTVEDIRDAIHVETRNKDQNIEEKPKASSIPQQEIPQEGSHLKQKITERIHNVTDIISHNIETVKSRIANSVENVKGRLHIRRLRDNEGFHKVTEGFSKSVKDYTYETKHFKPYKSVNPFQALVDENEPDYESDEDVVKESLVIKMKQRFMNGMNYIKSKLAFKRKGSIKKVKQEQEKEKQSLKKQFRQGLQILSGKISQNVEGVKRALRFRKDISLPEESPVEDLSPVREEVEVQGEAQVSQAAPEKTLKKSKSLKRSKKMKKGRKLENKTAQKQENWEEFHEIDSGFSKSVAEFERERRGKPAISVNPFDSLSAQNLSQSTRKVRKIEQPRPKKQVLKEKKVDNVQNQEKFHEISHGFSESVANFKRELRGAPLISNNPFSSLITRNVKKVQKKGKALIQKAKRTLRKSKDVNSEEKENIITPIA